MAGDHGLSADHSIPFQINDLLALWREDLNHVTCCFESGFDFPQRVALARASAAAKQGDEIMRG